ncbi:Hpt domain-containing protein [Gemmata sp. JC717]|uniref:Hpt domain-containing protein n=1 Tax=Gemmata algarum TaxID=2975278 RepID=A0ABU5F879_9BACT|nr:Hpt domain-containing protein [Gemmata algarum]MDY3556020.1 Hpt domain-containing protein [Gemmata algarum]MDY3563404.1 Hpt domain-containing protein [Gemmata algarum]
MPVDLDQLLGIFLDEAGEHLAALESGLLSVTDGAPDPEALNAVFRAAHSIKGGSGVFGFEGITRLTHALEQLLDRLRKGQLPVTRDRVDLMLRAVDGLNGQFAAVRAGAPADPPAALFEALTRAANGDAGGAAAPAAPPPAPAGPRVYQVVIVPGPRLLIDGMDPLLLIRNLGKRGELLAVAADLDAVPGLDELDPNRCHISWSVTIRTTETADDLKEVFAFVEGDCAVTVTEPTAAPHRTNLGASLAEYEAAYDALLAWVAARLPAPRVNDKRLAPLPT